jgi:hypothetical protein
VHLVFNNGQNIQLELLEGYGHHPTLHISKAKPFFTPDGLEMEKTTKVSSSQ